LIIKVENLHKYFGELEVLKGIDLEIAEQEVVCVIGPSGSGKSAFFSLFPSSFPDPHAATAVIKSTSTKTRLTFLKFFIPLKMPPF